MNCPALHVWLSAIEGIAKMNNERKGLTGRVSHDNRLGGFTVDLLLSAIVRDSAGLTLTLVLFTSLFGINGTFPCSAVAFNNAGKLFSIAV